MSKPWFVLGTAFLATGGTVIAVSQAGRHILWGIGLGAAGAVCWLLAARRRVTYSDEEHNDDGREP